MDTWRMWPTSNKITHYIWAHWFIRLSVNKQPGSFDSVSWIIYISISCSNQHQLTHNGRDKHSTWVHSSWLASRQCEISVNNNCAGFHPRSSAVRFSPKWFTHPTPPTKRYIAAYTHTSLLTSRHVCQSSPQIRDPCIDQWRKLQLKFVEFQISLDGQWCSDEYIHVHVPVRVYPYGHTKKGPNIDPLGTSRNILYWLSEYTGCVCNDLKEMSWCNREKLHVLPPSIVIP